MAALATTDDVETRLGRVLTDTESLRVDVMLEDASALVRRYTRQTFSLVEDDEVVIRAQGGEIRLPQRPVAAVSSVSAVGGNGLPDIPLVDWLWDGLDLVRLGEGNAVINLPEAWSEDDAYPGTYRVTYTHGYETVPADVVRVVCAVATRTLTAPSMVGGVRSESIGPYSYQLDPPGAGLAVSLTAADKEDLRDYRTTESQVKVRR